METLMITQILGLTTLEHLGVYLVLILCNQLVSFQVSHGGSLLGGISWLERLYTFSQIHTRESVWCAFEIYKDVFTFVVGVVVAIPIAPAWAARAVVF